MGDIPNLTPEQIESEIDRISEVHPVGQGGGLNRCDSATQTRS